MKEQYKNLGKVSVTPAGTWIRDNEYERLDIVTNSVTNLAYIAKKDVPSGINIDNVEYWQRIGGGSYKSNGLIILADVNPSTGELVQYTLLKAIRSIANSDRQPGLLLGFFGKDNNSTVPNKTTWYLYQYNCDNIEHFEELDYWVSVYDNVNKFRGYFTSEELLQENARYATIGDYAYVGTNMENAILYICNTTGIWSNTQTRAFIFANLYEAVNSKDFSDLDYSIDEQYSDRAEKDSLGRIIHFTYATKEGLNNAITEKVLKLLSGYKALPGSVGIEALDESVKEYIGSRGDIDNLPDGEDLTTRNFNGTEVLSFADKKYLPTSFSGLGRKYLRKNFVDGINVLEQYMINEPNTIYIIQYDYCLNGAEIEIPENCVLQFEGGSFNGGSIVGNNTNIISTLTRIFNLNVEIKGTWNLDYARPEWFGATLEDIDDALCINKSFGFNNNVKLAAKNYYIKSSIKLKTKYKLVGENEVVTQIIKTNKIEGEDNIAIIIENNSEYVTVSDIRITNLNVRNGDYGIKGESLNHSVFKNLVIFSFINGIYIEGNSIWSIKFDNVVSNANSLHQENSNYGYTNAYGFYIKAVNGGGTSLVFIKCWARDCYKGYYIKGMNYSTMLCNGADNINGIPYHFHGCKITLDACACENVYATINNMGATIHAINCVLFISSFNTYNIRPSSEDKEFSMIKFTDGGCITLTNCTFSNWKNVTNKCFPYAIDGAILTTINTVLPTNGKNFVSCTNNAKHININQNEYSVRMGNLVYYKTNTKYPNIGDNRPEPTVADKGFQYFDTTLNKPVWWNGSTWVDANGNNPDTTTVEITE